MKKYAAVLFLTALMVLQFSEPASARTNVAVSFAMPGLCVVVSNARPSPRHAWVDGCRHWYGGSYVRVPGHWRQAPVRETGYVIRRHDRYPDRYHKHRHPHRYDRYDRDDRGYRDGDRDDYRRGR